MTNVSSPRPPVIGPDLASSKPGDYPLSRPAQGSPNVVLIVLDDMGFPLQQDGRTEVPGLYFVGVQWMRKLKSTILYGVGEDAEIVARQLVEART